MIECSPVHRFWVIGLFYCLENKVRKHKKDNALCLLKTKLELENHAHLKFAAHALHGISLHRSLASSTASLKEIHQHKDCGQIHASQELFEGQVANHTMMLQYGFLHNNAPKLPNIMSQGMGET